MSECGICLETKELFALPCSKKHTLCDDCYKRLKTDLCPYCRKPFINIYREMDYIETESDPEPWLRLNHDWIVYSRIDRYGTEKIYTYRKGDTSWRNDVHMFEIKGNRKRRKK